MGTDIAVIERQLTSLIPELHKAIPPALLKTLPAERIVRTILVSLERTPRLMQCDFQSIVNAAWSAACLGLEVDGVTGQGFLVPFAGKAQLIIGYKGFNTMAARSGYTINADTVREGDDFKFQKGTNGYVRHTWNMGDRRLGKQLVGAWAEASHFRMPPIISILERDDLDAVKRKSPGSKKNDSPWNDPSVGFPAMCEKTVRRRLARSMPLNVMQLAAAFDTNTDMERHTYIDPATKDLIVEGEHTTVDQVIDREEPAEPPMDLSQNAPDKPVYKIIRESGEEIPFEGRGPWLAKIHEGMKEASGNAVRNFMKRHQDYFNELRATDEEGALKVVDIANDRLVELGET